MSQTTVAQALEWLASASGLTVRENRQELVDLLNRVRERIYLWYDELDTHVDLELCVCVDRFCHGCLPCGHGYLGFSLPPEAQAIEGAFLHGRSVTLHTRWRELREGLGGTGSPCRQHIHHVGETPFERHPDCCDECLRPRFRASSPQDRGKNIIIRGINEFQQKAEERVKLSSGNSATEAAWGQIDAIIPETPFCGGVEVTDQRGKVLANIPPGGSPAEFTRYRVEGIPAGAVIRIIASRRFMPVWYDLDIVETGNRLIIEELGRAFRNLGSSQAGGDAMQKALFHEQRAKSYIQAEQYRTSSVAASRSFFSGGNVRRSRLNSRR